MCEHLEALDKALQHSGIRETYRGSPWSKNCREWAYYDCTLLHERLRQQFNLPDFVEYELIGDPKAGSEAGLVCTKCHDAIMGYHPEFVPGKKTYPPS